jgi:hypothetical protein
VVLYCTVTSLKLICQVYTYCTWQSEKYLVTSPILHFV